MIRKIARRLYEVWASRAILVLLVVSFLAVSLIGVVGMSASVVVAKNLQGSGSAINVAGSLRRLTHRVSALIVAERLDGVVDRTMVDEAIAQFEGTLEHPALLAVLERDTASVPEAIYRGVRVKWRDYLKPEMQLLRETAWMEEASAADYAGLLGEVDAFVEQINALVAVLEHEAETRMRQLRVILAIALVLTVLVVLAALYVLRRRVFAPLADLRAAARRIAQRDFAVRSAYTGADELGQLGLAFNGMAGELSASYADLERRVERKTADLRRSNRSLELLYHVITRLYHSPASAEAYAETLRDIERTLRLRGSFACIQPRYGGPAAILYSSMAMCGDTEDPLHLRAVCEDCPGRLAPWSYRTEADADVLLVPLRDAEHVYGMLRLALPPGERLAPWQVSLIEAVSRHMGVALGISRQTERERLLALQEERSVIARELHDSLAQSLSFMKIQVSLLGTALADPEQREQAGQVVAELREGINSAYRQLRELLTSFRLRIEGDLDRLLQATAEEFSRRGDVPVDVVVRPGACVLGPNQEIHVLHLVREALSNATRHARATHIEVALECDTDGAVLLWVEDDGCGMDPHPQPEPHHYGLGIMAERAHSLGGELELGPRPGGGTRVAVRFAPQMNDNAVPQTPIELMGLK